MSGAVSLLPLPLSAFVPCTVAVLPLFSFGRNLARVYMSCLSFRQPPCCVSLSASDPLSSAEVGQWNRQTNCCSFPAIVFVVITL